MWVYDYLTKACNFNEITIREERLKMITVMDSMKEPVRSSEKGLDSQLWHACAGGMVQTPPVNSKVFYFPQGHAEHADRNVDFGNPLVPPFVPCRVSAVRFMADPGTDEVYARIGLIPVSNYECGIENDLVGSDKPASFAKTLTQSDANNGGGFSVPRYCAETIFPPLDYSAEPPVQTVIAKDVHGESWKFRHIYRGTPRRHLLTTGWSSFVNQKKLVAGDSIVFLRADKGELCVGIRRAKRGVGWDNAAYSPFDDKSDLSNVDLKGRVSAESVVEAARLAAAGRYFEVVYYPRSSTPEFVVKAKDVRAAMQVQWCRGMRFKMAFETEDSLRISWFMGTTSAAQVVDPIRWPTSPWRLLQVAWDEPDLLQNVKCVNPWLVELVSSMPPIHFSPFSPQRKKLRLSHNSDYGTTCELPMTPFSNNLLSPMCCIPDNVPAGIQGARHAHYRLSPSDLHSSPTLPLAFQPLPRHNAPPHKITSNNDDDNNISCLLTIGPGETKTPQLVLFGRTILTEEQISQSCSNDTMGNSSSDGNAEKAATNFSDQNVQVENSSDEVFPWYGKTELGLETGQCKVFLESDGVGRTLDLSHVGSYEELYGKLAKMFGIESSEMLSSILYRNAAGATKNTGDEPFGDFLKTARRLTIVTDSGSDNVGR